MVNRGAAGAAGGGHAGDPVAEITWSSLSLRDIAGQMAGLGSGCGKDALARMMRGDGCSLQGMSRTIEGEQHPGRDARFRRINAMIAEFRAAGELAVPVDAKKEEQPGPCHRPGRTWRPEGEPVRVRDHDFPGEELGKITPYGVYGIAAGPGLVSAGASCGTAASAVNALRLWWQREGALRYPGAGKLLVTCDAGGSDGYPRSCGSTSWPSWRRKPGRRSRCAASRPARPSGTRPGTGCSATSPAPGAPAP